MSPDLLSAFAVVLGWLAARLLLAYARRRHWTDEQKRAVPLVAVVVGAAVQGGGEALVQVLQGGGSALDVVLATLTGVAAGALPVAAHEITRTYPTAGRPSGES